MAGSHEDQPPLPSPPKQDITTNDNRHQSDTASGWYDVLARPNVITNPQTNTVSESQPMHYKTDYFPNEQLECEYDVIGSPKDAMVAEGSEPYPVFSVEGCYAEIDKSRSEMEEMNQSVKDQQKQPYPVFSAQRCYAEIDKRETKESSRSISVPATIPEKYEVSPTHEYAVVKKPKKGKSVDNLVNPSDVTNVPSPPPPPIPLITVSCEEAAEQCKELPDKNEVSAEQCKEWSNKNSNMMPTCNVLPLRPTATPTMTDSGHTEEGCCSNLAQSHPSQPLHTEDGNGLDQMVDMQEIPHIEC